MKEQNSKVALTKRVALLLAMIIVGALLPGCFSWHSEKEVDHPVVVPANPPPPPPP